MTTEEIAAGEGRTPTAESMKERTRQHDWAATPLGERALWPATLRTTIDLMLASGHAMCVMWGPERIFLYNDAYAPMAASKLLAAPASQDRHVELGDCTADPLDFRDETKLCTAAFQMLPDGNAVDRSTKSLTWQQALGDIYE